MKTNEPKKPKGLCSECLGMSWRRTKPHCRGCLQPYQDEKQTKEYDLQRTDAPVAELNLG